MKFLQRIKTKLTFAKNAIVEFFTNTKRTHINAGGVTMAKGDVIINVIGMVIMFLPIGGARVFILPLKFALTKLTSIGLDRYTHLKTDVTPTAFNRQFAVYAAVAIVGGIALFAGMEIPAPIILVILTQLPIYL